MLLTLPHLHSHHLTYCEAIYGLQALCWGLYKRHSTFHGSHLLRYYYYHLIALTMFQARLLRVLHLLIHLLLKTSLCDGH